jgi:phage head maturation protease
MNNSFIYSAAIADKLDGMKQGAIEQNSEGFSTVSDEIDHKGDKRKVSISVCIIYHEGYPSSNSLQKA